MTKTKPEPDRVAVWVAMADHFLDTESRPNLPLTALCCLDAELTVDEAREIWQYEISPAVGFNLRSVAGEWAFWDREWLVARIEQVRHSWWNRPGRWRHLHWPVLAGEWLTIERCMKHLQTISARRERIQRANDLTFLARYCFDAFIDEAAELEPDLQARIRRLFPEPFLPLVTPALLASERPFAKRRMHSVIEELCS